MKYQKRKWTFCFAKHRSIIITFFICIVLPLVWIGFSFFPHVVWCSFAEMQTSYGHLGYLVGHQVDSDMGWEIKQGRGAHTMTQCMREESQEWHSSDNRSYCRFYGYGSSFFWRLLNRYYTVRKYVRQSHIQSFDITLPRQSTIWHSGPRAKIPSTPKHICLPDGVKRFLAAVGLRLLHLDFLTRTFHFHACSRNHEDEC